MSTPLTAQLRIKVPYTQSGMGHVYHAYCKSGDAIAPGMTLDYRDASSVSWRDAAAGLGVALGPLISGGFGDAILEAFDGTLWNFVDAEPILASASGTFKVAAQWTLVLRDTLGKKVRSIVMEGQAGALPYHTNSQAVAIAAGALVKPWTDAAINPDDPYSWQVSRANQFLNVAPFVGFTMTLNTKIRRARGLT